MKLKFTPEQRARIVRDARRFNLVGLPYKVALAESQKEERLRVLRKMLSTGIVDITFKAASKKLQRALGTTMPAFVPKRKIEAPRSKNLLNFYDVQLKGWRECRPADIVKVSSK